MIQDARVYADKDALMAAAAEESMRIATEAISKRGRFAFCLSGGHSPAPLYTRLAAAQKQIDWSRTHLFWGDERYVGPDDKFSNYRMARETLISHIAIPSENVHPMHTDFPSADEAARSYESILRDFFGAQPPAFDLQLLGIGPEGHTASLFPDSPALNEQSRWVVAVVAPAEPPQRLTLTLPVLNQARNNFFIADGSGKHEIVQAIRNEPDSRPSRYPVGRIRPVNGRVIWFLDQAASQQSAGM